VDSAAVLNAVAVVGGALITALLGIIGVLLGKILGNTNKTVDHVANSHVDAHGNPINLRDDLDEKFEDLAGLVNGVADTQRDQAKDIGGLRSDIRQVRTEQALDRAAVADAARDAATAARKAEKAASDAVLALERTQPRTSIQKENQND
jgi:uncharacterized damage-inducible protein DinB